MGIGLLHICTAVRFLHGGGVTNLTIYTNLSHAAKLPPKLSAQPVTEKLESAIIGVTANPHCRQLQEREPNEPNNSKRRSPCAGWRTGIAAGRLRHGAAVCPGQASTQPEPVTLTMSWWGDDARTETYQQAIQAFEAKLQYITVETIYGTTADEDQTADVMQVDWTWPGQNADQFVDLNEYSDVIDLEQFSQSALDACTVDGALLAVPMSVTGRIFYWNTCTFEQAGIDAPKTYEELLTAGNTFREVLGEEYYPLAMDAAARMNLMVSYLESTTGKAWVVDRQLQYSADEIKTGLEFLQALEENHVMPTLAAQQTNGTLDQTPMWQNGQYAGTFAWDADAETYRSALKNASGFLVGDEIAFGGQANGGFSKVYLALAINSSCQHPKEAAILVNFLLNEDMGASIMGTACGLPDSVTGRTAATAAGLVNPLVVEANNRMMAFVDFPLDPTFESPALAAVPDGLYAAVLTACSNGELTTTQAAEQLAEGITAMLDRTVAE